jgi:hypothetical protein
MAYMVGKGHQHFGPGTSMIQFHQPNQYFGLSGLGMIVAPGNRYGLGDCESIAELASCCDSCSAGGTCARGLAGCGCGGSCDKKGLGLFESGMDFSGWGLPEWSIVALGGYMILSTVFTTGRAVRKVRAIPGERRKRRAKQLRAEAAELSRK